MISGEIRFPKGSTFWNVEGVPVVMLPTPGSPIPTVRAFPACDPARPFPWDSALRNGTPISEAEFRVDAGLPAKPRPPRNLTQGPKGFEFFDVEGVPVVVTPGSAGKWPSVIAFDPGKPPRSFPLDSAIRNGAPVTEARFREIAGLPAMRPAHLSELVGDDGIPTLDDDDPAAWNTAAAADAARIAAAAISRAALHTHRPLASVADDGRALVLDSKGGKGWAASRDASGNWAAGIAFSADDLKDSFRRAPAAAAAVLLSAARAALH